MILEYSSKSFYISDLSQGECVLEEYISLKQLVIIMNFSWYSWCKIFIRVNGGDKLAIIT